MIHPTAEVHPDATIGDGTDIWRHALVRAGAVIGKNCMLGHCSYVCKNVRIGDGVRIQNHVNVFTGVELHDDVFVGPSVVFTNVRTPRAFVSRKDQFQKTIVKRGAAIGAGAFILCGVTIGEYAMIGAGTIITKDVPDHTLVYNSIIETIKKRICKCGKWDEFATMKGMVVCRACNERYDKDFLQ